MKITEKRIDRWIEAGSVGAMLGAGVEATARTGKPENMYTGILFAFITFAAIRVFSVGFELENKLKKRLLSVTKRRS